MARSLHMVAALALTTILHFTASSQSLSINTTGLTADPSAILDVSSTSKGTLIPRMNKTQRNLIAAPVTGLLVFQNNPDSTGFYYYSGSGWVWLADALNIDTLAWKNSGNNNITASRFLGTLNDSALKLRVKNQPSGIVDSMSFNTGLGYGTLRNVNYAGGSQGKINSAFGYRALDSITTGSANTAIGSYSLATNKTGINNVAVGNTAMFQSPSGSNNTVIGNDAGRLISNNDNTAVGGSALHSNTTGSGNTSTGAYSSQDISTGIWNTANGYYALESNTTGNYNTAIGVASFDQATTASNNVGVGTYSAFNVTSNNNVFVGHTAGQGVAGRSTGGDNTAVGMQSLYAIRGGTRNTALGLSALFLDSTGGNNVALGAAASQLRLRGDDNVVIGSFAGEGDTASSRTVLIGRRAGRNNQRDDLVALGYEALINNSIGLTSATQADSALYNTGVGYHSLVSNNKGGWNTAVGYQAANNNSTGFYNVALGVNALYNTTVSDNNTAVGTRAGDGFNNGARNTFLGSLSDANAAGRINATAIGANALVAQDNSMVLGSINGVNGATANTSVGIGTTTPGTMLDVNGTFTLGINGTALNEIIKQTIVGNIPAIGGNGITNFTLAVPNAVVGATVALSPATALATGTTIAYGFVTAPNVVTVYVGNVTTSPIGAQASVSFNVTIIR